MFDKFFDSRINGKLYYTTSNENIVCVIDRTTLLEIMTEYSDKNDTVVIAIAEPDFTFSDEYVKEFKKFHSTLVPKFWDVSKPILDSKLDMTYHPINDNVAKEIREFINNNKGKRFIISCRAGKSRSAGVAMAVQYILNGCENLYHFQQMDMGSFITKHPRYVYNETVFKKIIGEM